MESGIIMRSYFINDNIIIYKNVCLLQNHKFKLSDFCHDMIVKALI